VIEVRLAGQPSVFERFDLPGIAFYWRKLGRAAP
jgi:hypothetical protein